MGSWDRRGPWPGLGGRTSTSTPRLSLAASTQGSGPTPTYSWESRLGWVVYRAGMLWGGQGQAFPAAGCQAPVP